MVRIGRRGAEPQGSDVGMWKYEGIWLVLSTRDLLFEGKFQQDSRHKEQAKSYMTVRKKSTVISEFIYLSGDMFCVFLVWHRNFGRLVWSCFTGSSHCILL
jgi:hypothetical protein